MKKKFWVYNSFTQELFGGNPAGIVPNADDLSDAQMQAIARQLNLVETVFILNPRDADKTCALRYFMPEQELPIAGHPTIAAWSYLADHEPRTVRSKELHLQETKAGPIEISVQNGKIYASQKSPEIRILSNFAARDVADVLGMKPESFSADLPMAVVDAGLGHLIFSVVTLDALMSLSFDPERLAALCQSVGARECQIFCTETLRGQAQAHTRNLCPRYGLEDPACGNGNAALGAYFHCFIAPGPEKRHFLFEQGDKVGMPSMIEVLTETNADSICVKIGGHAKQMVEGEICISEE